MIKWGYSVSLRNSCEELKQLGDNLLATGEFCAMEVTYSEHMRHIDTKRFNEVLAEFIETYNTEITVHFPGFNLAEENEALQRAIKEEFDNCCKYTKKLNGNAIIVHCGSNKLLHVSIFHEDGSRQTHSEVYDKLWKLSIETMRDLCDIAAKYNIIVYTENLSDNNLIQTSEQLHKYIDEVDKANLAIVFDVGHSHFTTHDVMSEVLACGKRLKHLHIHDNHGIKDEHLPVGEGNIKWDEFIKSLGQMEYDGIYLMEMYHSTLPALTKCKKELLKYM